MLRFSLIALGLVLLYVVVNLVQTNPTDTDTCTADALAADCPSLKRQVNHLNTLATRAWMNAADPDKVYDAVYCRTRKPYLTCQTEFIRRCVAESWDLLVLANMTTPQFLEDLQAKTTKLDALCQAGATSA